MPILIDHDGKECYRSNCTTNNASLIYNETKPDLFQNIEIGEWNNS